VVQAAPTVALDQAPTLSDSQKAALIKLLADDDSAIYQTIRSKILSYGPAVAAWLRPHTFSKDPVLRRRAQEIVQHLARQDADNRFLTFCLHEAEGLDVETGIWLLAQTQYPDINVAAYQALLDSYAGDLRERIVLTAGAEKILTIINEYLFANLGYAGNEANYYDPENSYLNRVVDRRSGNPISLCLVYLLVGRRLRLPIAGIGLPGHFLCRFQTPKDEIFVDAFHQGKLLTKADCIKYLLQSGHGYEESHLAPVTPRRTLLRICSNLHKIYVDLELVAEASRMQRYMVALAK
jgi:regulator of sirC expression with transglutaminase-like and TPR domain